MKRKEKSTVKKKKRKQLSKPGHTILEEHKKVHHTLKIQCVSWLFVKFHDSDYGESATNNLKLRKSRLFTQTLIFFWSSFPSTRCDKHDVINNCNHPRCICWFWIF